MEEPMFLDGRPAGNSKETENAPRRKTVLSIWKEFGDNTTMHGLGRAIHSKRVWKRIVWSILVIGAACVASMNFYKTLESYFTYPVTTNVELKSRRKMDFPAVTICNLSPARLGYLDSRIQEALNRSLQNKESVEKQEQVFKLKTSQIYKGDDIDRREETYYNISDMIIDCRFDQMPCSAEEEYFTSIDSFKYGKCFTFNPSTPPQRIERAGNKNGLILELDIQQDEYLPFVSTTGIKVLIHPQSVMPFPEDSGIVAAPGRSTSIGIRRMSVSRQPPPWGECIHPEDVNNAKINMFGDEFKYTTTVCEKTCYQRSVFERCRCCDENYPCNEKALIKMTGLKMEDEYIPDCDESNREVLQCLKYTREDYYAGILPCMEKCRPACKEVSYETSYATGSWPGGNFMDNLAEKAKQSIKSKTKSFTNYPDPLTGEFVANNFLRLEVYFENFVEEVILTNPAYDWNKLLSDIGGQLGLWLGFSIMTAVEVIELLYDIISFICRRAGKK